MTSTALASPTLTVTSRAPANRALALHRAALDLLPTLIAGTALNARALRTTMEAAFGGSDAQGLWTWKDAYEACEAAQIAFLHRFGSALCGRPASSQLAVVSKIAGLLPTHTRRSIESEALQQFSTPLPLAWVAARAAMITRGDLVLEPSAGTGLLAIFAELAGAEVALNELGETRADLLGHLFSTTVVTRFDAAHIHDHLDAGLLPSVVLMNPPFSVVAQVEGRVADAALRHINSALARLAEGGRLVAITGASLSPYDATWRDAFIDLQARGRIVFSAAIDGRVYARHGTTTETRLTVIDRLPADDPSCFAATPGMASSTTELLAWVDNAIPARLPMSAAFTPSRVSAKPAMRKSVASPARSASQSIDPAAVPLRYSVVDWSQPAADRITEALYEGYGLQSVAIDGACPHPTPLVQSASMASVCPPKPNYVPLLPDDLVEAGLLSDAQLETVIYAGEAHDGQLAGAWTVDATFDQINAAPENADGMVRFRRGFMLGDGTGAGKGRQVAGVILDNWLKGRRRALWVSKSEALLEDAQRDWSALGQERLLVTPLSRFRQGAPIRLEEGILFATYATLRSDEREGKVSRVRQIVDWLGSDFDGVIVFDESHAMQNAAGGKGERGEQAASQQGKAGLRLQHALPDARVLYVSATGATTVHNLAYAQRLGLWGGDDFPFANRAEFVQAIEAGGVAAMEVLARDLKALGLYAARSLSYEGVEYEIIEHRLTAEQTGIYDAYAGAFEIIHNNLSAALEASNITGAGPDGGTKTLNAQAKSAARSAFESAKQRFFNHLITAMKTPTLIAAIDRDLAEGHACVVQIVSTGEALLERRLADIPTEEWGDIAVDVTPREYVLDYLAHSFPTQLFEPYTDSEGNMCSRPVMRDGQPVQCRDALERRDRLIEHLGALAPVQGALDQIVQRFGTEQVAEVTGRSRRVVAHIGADGERRLCVENRAGSANLAETAAFQDDDKRVLVFSDAGGTGRSYHADLGARNRRLRIHYLLEAGWKADTAIQGLGRTNRTHQVQPPIFRPISTDVKAEKRFLSTIARRLDTLGAITKGQRQTGGQGLFRAEDNLESAYAKAALRQLYTLLLLGKVPGCTLQRFEDATALKLTDRDGTLREELPPITQFLNRMLALTIDLQGTIFDVFEGLLRAKIEGAIAAGVYDRGVETITAHSLRVTERRTLYTHPATGAETQVFTVVERNPTRPISLAEAVERGADRDCRLLINHRSKRAAVQIPAPSLTLDDGEVERRVRLLRPVERMAMAQSALEESAWEAVDAERFAHAWSAEIAELPAFTEVTSHVVTGLLLPIWRRLPGEGCRVYRLQTDDGERVIGRQVAAAWVAQAFGDAPVSVAASDAFAAVLTKGDTLHLTDAMSLRRSLVMGVQRIELVGFTSAMVARLKAIGLISEIIAWKLRLFIPTGSNGPSISASLLSRHPIERIAPRAATRHDAA